MVDFETVDPDTYVSKLNEHGWGFEETIARLVKKSGWSLSHVPFIKAVLRTEMEREDSPLAGLELLHDAYEMTILGQTIDRLIKENL